MVGIVLGFKCPKCNSLSLSFESQAFVLYWIGNQAGTGPAESDQVKLTCIQCGYDWKPEGLRNVS